MKRVLVLDGQVFQTPAWHRGMGKYSFELMQALYVENQKSQKWSSIRLVLSKNLKVDSEFNSKTKSMKHLNIDYLDIVTNEFDNQPVANKNRIIIDKYFEDIKSLESCDGFDYLVFSLMQSEIAPAFSSKTYVTNALIFYDLIPYMFHDIYLQDPLAKRGYLSKFSELLRADLYYAISKTVANDITLYLGVDPVRVVSVDGGPIKHADKSKFMETPENFILMPTGDDLRKNNRRAVEGFKIFNSKNSNKYKLLITSTFTNAEIDQLNTLCPDLVFTGNISGEELDYLYEKTEALLFPSEYEGLGMPILEALEKNKPIACSDISVFREMSDTVLNYFNPENVNEIASSLGLAVNTKMEKYEKEIQGILSRYSWLNSARSVAESFGNHNKEVIEKLPLIIYAPLSEGTLLGSYIQKNHSELSRFFNIKYNLEPATVNRSESYQTISYLNYAESNTKNLSDTTNVNVLHIIDNNNCVSNMLSALAVPGCIYLHSLDLSELWHNMVKENLISPSRYDAEVSLNNKFGSDSEKFIVSLLARSNKILVNNKITKDKVSAILKNLKEDQKKVRVVPIELGSVRYRRLLDSVTENKELICVTGNKAETPIWFTELRTDLPKKVISVSANKNEFQFVNSVLSNSILLIDMNSMLASEVIIMQAIINQLSLKKYLIIDSGIVSVMLNDKSKLTKPGKLAERIIEIRSNSLTQEASDGFTSSSYSKNIYLELGKK